MRKPNLLLNTDVYKFGHAAQYPEGTTKVYSYLQARSDKKFKATVFYGLQYYIKEYLMRPVTNENVDEFIAAVESILGPGMVTRDRYQKLVDLGYLPLEIKAVPEGTIVPNRNVLMTITNTHPDFYWLVGFTESLLLKVWNTCTVATNSKLLRDTCKRIAEATCDDLGHLGFQIHDFGYRGCSSEETAALSGSAHLLSFFGTDTVPAVSFVREYYGVDAGEPIGLSVPATEHSVMCSYTRENEFEAFQTMLKLYPKGIVSIVSDTYNLWNVLTNFAHTLRHEIMERDGKVVFRPDSGNPVEIILGKTRTSNPVAWSSESPEDAGALKLLWQEFGGTINSKGFKVLNPKVGLIYGDGIYPERMEEILNGLMEMGFAASNIVFGVGGLLLQNFNRDTLVYALKATYVEVNGEKRSIVKDPITDPGKKSHTGLMTLIQNSDGTFQTLDNATPEEEQSGILQTVFKDGTLVKETTFSEIRRKIQQ